MIQNAESSTGWGLSNCSVALLLVHHSITVSILLVIQYMYILLGITCTVKGIVSEAGMKVKFYWMVQ